MRPDAHRCRPRHGTPARDAVTMGGMLRAASFRPAPTDRSPPKIHRVLHGPADTEGLHPRQRFRPGVVEMGDGPAQRRDRRLLVDLFIEVEQLVDGFVLLPMDGDRQPLLCGPANDLEEFGLGAASGELLLYMRAGDALADAVEAQHVVAETHRQERREALGLLEFRADILGEQAVGDPYRQ